LHKQYGHSWPFFFDGLKPAVFPLVKHANCLTFCEEHEANNNNNTQERSNNRTTTFYSVKASDKNLI